MTTFAEGDVYSGWIDQPREDERRLDEVHGTVEERVDAKVSRPERDFVYNGWVDGLFDRDHLVLVQQQVGDTGHEEVHGHCARVAAGLTVGESVRIRIVDGPGWPIVVVETPSRVWNTDLPDELDLRKSA